MKPADNPEFFRFPAPEGRSRESTIALDAEGHFSHEGEKVEHMGLEQAMHTWITRHPDDGRYILSNGYDWTYFTVADAPFFVRHLEVAPPASTDRSNGASRTNGGGPDTIAAGKAPSGDVVLVLSDGSKEPLDPATLTEGDGGALYVTVKKNDPRGPFEAKLTRHAQTSLVEFVSEDEDGKPVITTGGVSSRFFAKSRNKSRRK